MTDSPLAWEHNGNLIERWGEGFRERNPDGRTLGNLVHLPSDAVPLVPVTEVDAVRRELDEARAAVARAQEEIFQRELSIDLGPGLGEWGVNTLCEFIGTASMLLGIKEGDYAALMQMDTAPSLPDPDSPEAPPTVWRDADGWTARRPDGSETRVWHDSWGELRVDTLRKRIDGLKRVMWESAAQLAVWHAQQAERAATPPADDAKVEELAQALLNGDDIDLRWSDASAVSRDIWRSRARAALAWMRRKNEGGAAR